MPSTAFFQARHGICARVTCEPVRSGRVRLRTELVLPLPPERVWEVVADAPRFLTIDPFHERVALDGPRFEPGTAIVLWHNFLGVRLRRLGRVLKFAWNRGYAFSDLSARGADRGFPHVFAVEVHEVERGPPPRTRLAIEVKGKWTARWIPPFAVRRWLLAVGSAHARLLGEELSRIGGRTNGS